MSLLIAFAFLAGIVTVLSPCILPVLPVVLSGSVGGGESRPWGIIVGFVSSFTVFTLTLGAMTRALGIPADVMRYAAAVTILLFGLVMVVPFLKEKFSAFASSIGSRTAGNARAGSAYTKSGSGDVAPGVGKYGFSGGFVLGLSLGLVWTPCVGPIMASVISLSLSGQTDADSILIILAYSAGTALPLFLIMKGGRGLLRRFPVLSRNTDKIQKAFGLLMVITSLALFTGADRSFQSWLLDVFPDYGSGLTAIEERESVRKALESRSGSDTIPVPDFSVGKEGTTAVDPLPLGSGVWINSAPLSAVDLVGKVVLIDFWTYSCINCIRTLPYLRAWHDRYADAGLVVIGVHSPEFAFERSEANVRKAALDLGVNWPVAMDNDFGIWKAYANRYWPAHYLYGRDGKLADTHFGEGAYKETERLIQKLLGVSAPIAANGIRGSEPIAADRSPETYLGYGRSERFASPEPLDRDGTADYKLPPGELETNQWGLEGRWTVGNESAVAEAGSSISFRFQAAGIYLVMNPLPGEALEAFVTVDGRPVDGGDVQSGVLSLDSDRLYRLYEGAEPASGTLRIEFRGKAEVYAFTFG
ncbi:MAG: cytochrome c biogenesis protein DipZ [Spirochaetota bacterium]